MKRLIGIAVAAGLFACGGDMVGSVPLDAGAEQPDAGAVAPPDAGVVDAGRPQAELAWAVCCAADGGCFLAFSWPTCAPVPR